MNLSSLVELQRNKLGSIRNTCITDVFDNKMGQRKDPQRTPDNTSIMAAKKPHLAAHHGLHSSTKVPFLSSSEYRDWHQLLQAISLLESLTWWYTCMDLLLKPDGALAWCSTLLAVDALVCYSCLVDAPNGCTWYYSSLLLHVVIKTVAHKTVLSSWKRTLPLYPNATAAANA